MPDNKTVMKMVPGTTENRIYQAMEWLYYDNSLLKSGNLPFEKGYLTAPVETEEELKKRNTAFKKTLNYEKGLVRKVINTIGKYCEVEKLLPESVETILLTGGMLKLAPNDGTPGLRKKMMAKFKQELPEHFPKARTIFSEEP